MISPSFDPHRNAKAQGAVHQVLPHWTGFGMYRTKQVLPSGILGSQPGI
jgi:hypothetical protein